MAEAVKRIRLEISSANPNLTGIRSTINSLERLNTVLRRVNQQAALLSRTTGLDLANMGRGVDAAAARISSAMGTVTAASKKAAAEVNKAMQAHTMVTDPSGKPLSERERYTGRRGGERSARVQRYEYDEEGNRKLSSIEQSRRMRTAEEQAARDNEARAIRQRRAQERQDRERDRRDEARADRADAYRRKEAFDKKLNDIRSQGDKVRKMKAQDVAKHQAQQQHRGPLGGILGNEGRLINRGLRGFTPQGFGTNVLTVGGWMTAVNAFYGIVNLAQHSLQRIEGIQLQTARLEQVFRGVGGSARELTDDVLKLAASEGRSADEAVASAIAWSRLGPARRQVNEATRVSLMAANVAEMSAGETTQHLAAVMAGFGLEVSQLQAVLGMLNQTSNTYRVTNADLLLGLSRVSSIAQQAGLSLAELQGILGATVQKTGQTGANIANALKTTLVRMNRPDVQEFFSSRYGIETTGSAEDLQKIYELYVKANDAQRRDILLKVGAATQANRLRAIFEAYPESLNAAIQSLLHLNSAEEENVKITNTMAASRQRLVTAWDRFVASPEVAQGISGIFNNMAGLISGVTGGPSQRRKTPLYFDPSQSTIIGSALGMVRYGAIGGFANQVSGGAYDRLIQRWQGFATTPQTSEQVGEEASRYINAAQGRGEANQIIAKLLRSEGKLFSIRTPSGQGVMRDILKNYIKPEDIGNQEAMNKKAEEYETISARNFRWAEGLRGLEIQRLELAVKESKTDDEKKDAMAELNAKQNERLKAQKEFVDSLQDEETTRDAISRAMEIQKQLAQDIAKGFKGLGLSDYNQELLTTMAQIEAVQAQHDAELNPDVRGQLDKKMIGLHAQRSYLLSPAGRTFNRFGMDSEIMGAMTKAEFGEGVGITQGDRLLNQRKRVESELNRLGVNDKSSQNDRLRALTLLNQLRNVELSLSTRLLENDRERKQLLIESAREFQKSLVGAGPGELLRKLAAFQLNRKGMNAGSFFALSPDLQRDVYDLRGGDRAADLNREAGQLRGSTWNATGLQDRAAMLDALALSVGSTLQSSFDVSKLAADAVAASMGGAAKYAEIVAANMERAAKASAAIADAPTTPNAEPVSQNVFSAGAAAVARGAAIIAARLPRVIR